MMPHSPIEKSIGKACYQRTSQGMVFAISFAISAHHHLIAPYASFIYAEMLRPEEIVFYYSFGEVHVLGQKLETLHDATHAHELKSVCCVESPEDDNGGARVTEIAFRRRDFDEP